MTGTKFYIEMGLLDQNNESPSKMLDQMMDHPKYG